MNNPFVKTEPDGSYNFQYNGQGFEWPTFLRLAKEGLLLPDSIASAKNRAMRWPTRACGNQCATIPRDWTGMPLDDQLIHWGKKFNAYVHAENWEYAEWALGKIEQRSALILRRMNHPLVKFWRKVRTFFAEVLS